MSRLLAEQAPSLLGPVAFLAKVVSVQDPNSRNRVQVKLFTVDGIAGQDGPVWARVAAPFSGNGCGAFFIPNVGDEVVVTHLAGDSRFPVVIGGLWNGHDSAPETIGGDRVDRWTITGTAGTRIAIVEESSSSPTIRFSTPGGLTGTMTDEGGGSIEFTNSMQTSVKIDTSGVTINAPSGTVQVTAATSVDVTAPQLNVSAASSIFSGIVQCQVLQASSVISDSYTPGAGNVW